MLWQWLDEKFSDVRGEGRVIINTLVRWYCYWYDLHKYRKKTISTDRMMIFQRGGYLPGTYPPTMMGVLLPLDLSRIDHYNIVYNQWLFAQSKKWRFLFFLADTVASKNQYYVRLRITQASAFQWVSDCFTVAHT